jgi:hypothetical protein
MASHPRLLQLLSNALVDVHHQQVCSAARLGRQSPAAIIHLQYLQCRGRQILAACWLPVWLACLVKLLLQSPSKLTNCAYLQDLQRLAVQAVSYLLLYLVAAVADPYVFTPEAVRLQQCHYI